MKQPHNVPKINNNYTIGFERTILSPSGAKYVLFPWKQKSKRDINGATKTCALKNGLITLWKNNAIRIWKNNTMVLFFRSVIKPTLFYSVKIIMEEWNLYNSTWINPLTCSGFLINRLTAMQHYSASRFH